MGSETSYTRDIEYCLKLIILKYKTLLGIMVGVMVTFVIGIGVVINLMGKVAS